MKSVIVVEHNNPIQTEDLKVIIRNTEVMFEADSDSVIVCSNINQDITFSLEVPNALPNGKSFTVVTAYVDKF